MPAALPGQGLAANSSAAQGDIVPLPCDGRRPKQAAMAAQGDTNRAGFRLVRRLALLAMIVAIVGLPIDHLFGYALLGLAILLAFAGEVTPQARRWLAAAFVTVAVIAGQFVLATPKIEEGHNVFLPGGTDNALTAGLPPDVFRIMAAQFDALYPPAQRCDPKQPGCWQSAPMPDRTFAFSADGIFDRPEFSRRVDGIDFADPVWLRLGFINEFRYNWTPKPGDLERARRDRRFWMGLHRWHLLMPYFVMVRLPAEFTGGQLCWRGDIVWEDGADRFTLLNQYAWGCRVIEKEDAGRRIFGLGIRPDTLAMKLEPPAALWLQQMAAGALSLIGAGAVIGLLVRWRMRALLLPVLLAGAALLSIAVDDASFIGGVRPFDGGDDGLYYDGAARRILLHLLDGNLLQAIEGGEKVFYYGGPGFRYLRALEHVAFGESYLGYLALILFLPIAVFGIFQRFVPRTWAIASAIVFVAIPVGAVFGTSFFLYAKNAARGYGDPAAAIFALCGTLLLAGLTPNGPGPAFWPAARGGVIRAGAQISGAPLERKIWVGGGVGVGVVVGGVGAGGGAAVAGGGAGAAPPRRGRISPGARHIRAAEPCAIHRRRAGRCRALRALSAGMDAMPGLVPRLPAGGLHAVA